MKLLPLPKSVRQYLKIAVFLSTIFGLISIREIDNIYQVSKWGRVISISYITLLLSLFSYHFHYSLNSVSLNAGTNGTIYLRLYTHIMGTFFTSIIIASGIFTWKTACNLSNRILRMEEKYFSSKTKAVNSLSLKYLSTSILIYFAFIIFDYFYFTSDSVFSLISIYVFILYTFLTISQISILLFWLKKNLTKFRTCLPYYVSTEQIDAVILNDLKNMINLQGQNRLDNMQNLRCLYHDLYLLSQEINDLFATRILIIVGHNFVLGTIYMYWGIKLLNSNEETALIVCYFKWALASFVSISGLIWPCRTVCNEGKRIAITVQELQTLIKDPRIKQELESFSVQLIHEKMEFSPHDFFFLKNELLLSILGAVASYLVILSQFQI